LLSYPSAISLSSRSLNHLAKLLRAEHRARGGRWRRLTAGRQALLVLAHLRNGDTFARLAAGFRIGLATAWRYVQEALTALAALAEDLPTAMGRIMHLAYVIVDGTLIPIDRVHHEAPYYSGKHRRHGVNVQVITDPLGNLVWLSPALPGRTHDLTAARTHGIIDALTHHQMRGFADKAYQGAGGTIATPRKPHKYRRKLTPEQKWVNHAHSAIRAHGERANAMLKTWRILTKLRLHPRHATTLLRAQLVLTQHQHSPRDTVQPATA
jgi:hypothetical protein